MNVDVGTLIAGKYELVRLLGKGAMGEVWLATHNSLGGEFAIKLVEPADDMEAETAAGRFQLEAQIAAKLSRKTRHIVSVSDHGEEDGLAYLVMELLEGESLESRTKRQGQLEVPEVAALVLQVSRALSLAHEEGIFHRDLKPANVWLGKDEDGRLLVKLLDFGIARSKKPFRTRSPFATSKDMVLGTPSYMSPEQARGLESLDYRCDLWALSVVAYEALTKKIPFEGETVEDIFLSICTFRVVPVLARRPDLPPAAEAFFARAFAPKLEDRFNSASELSDAFERLVDPAALEHALGIVLTPSARRLEVARQSNPNFGSNPNLQGYAQAPQSHPHLPPYPQSSPQLPPYAQSNATLPAYQSSPNLMAAQIPTPNPSQPMYPVGVPGQPPLQRPPSHPDFMPESMNGQRISSPDLNVAVGGPTVMTRRKSNGGIWIAIALLAGIIGIGGLVLVMKKPSGVGGKQPEPTVSAGRALPTETNAAAATNVESPPATPTSTPETPTSAAPATPTKPGPVAAGKPATKPSPAPAPKAPEPPVVFPSMPKPTPAPVKSATPAPAKSGGRSDVF